MRLRETHEGATVAPATGQPTARGGHLTARYRWALTQWRSVGWPAKGLLLAGALQLTIVTLNAHDAYGGRMPDLRWIHLGVRYILDGGHPYDVYMFLYAPSAGILLAPLGLLGWTAARVLFLATSAVAIAAAGAVSLRAAGLRWNGTLAGLLLLVLAVSPPVTLTLNLGNVNGYLVLCEALALAAMLASRWTAAGIALGLGLAIKPIAAPLLVFPLLARRWGAAAVAIAIPVVLTVVAVAINPNAFDFFSDRVSLLLHGAPPVLARSNTTIVGAFENLSMPHAAASALRLATIVVALALAWRRWVLPPQPGEPRSLRLLEVAGVLILAELLCFSFSWPYYGIYLLPLLVTVVHRQALLRHPFALVGIALMCSPIALSLARFRDGTRTFEQVRPTLAWLLILAGMALAFLRLEPLRLPQLRRSAPPAARSRG